MSANTKIVVLLRKELLYTGIFAALGVLFVILLLMLLLPGKAADTSGAPDSPDSTAETVMPDNVADLGRIPQSAQTEDVSTGAVADTDAKSNQKLVDGPAGANGGKGGIAQHIADDHGIHGIIELLEEARHQNGQHKDEQALEDGAVHQIDVPVEE